MGGQNIYVLFHISDADMVVDFVFEVQPDDVNKRSGDDVLISA